VMSLGYARDAHACKLLPRAQAIFTLRACPAAGDSCRWRAATLPAPRELGSRGRALLRIAQQADSFTQQGRPQHRRAREVFNALYYRLLEVAHAHCFCSCCAACFGRRRRAELYASERRP
jgi:hypothetical protein